MCYLLSVLSNEQVRPGKGKAKLINVAAYDRAVGETTDLSRQQGALTCPADLDRGAVEPDLERAEHPKHHSRLSPHQAHDSLALQRLRQGWDSRETQRRDTPGERDLVTQSASSNVL